MALSSRSSRRFSDNTWPGFVDALASLLMVIIFLLMIFVIAQVFLGDALTGRDQALDRLRGDLSEMADLLSLERKANEDLRLNVQQLSSELQASIAAHDELAGVVRGQTDKLATQSAEIGKLGVDIEALTALRDQLRQQIAEADAKLAETAGSLAQSQREVAKEREISEESRAQLALANKQMAALREQLARISLALDAAEAVAREQKVQIANLGSRLNAALAGKVQELSRYRSEFFGRLREALGNHPDINIVGDRFVFQSEVLFGSGSADLGTIGQERIAQLARTLIEISTKIPADIQWILRVDGHTDKVPIRNLKFASNWELSAARAISVVDYLIELGVPPERLAATGFGEFQPIDPEDTPAALSRNRRIEFKLTER